MPAKRLSLNEKIFRIANSCAVIQRSGVGENPNDAAKPLYAYAKIDDVLDAITPLLKKYRLVLTGSVPKEPMTHVGKTFATTEVMVEWTLMDLDGIAALIAGETCGPYQQTYRVPGAGNDDAGKGIYKALTGSRKYACIFIFNLRIGDEPEAVTAKPATGEATAQAAS